MENHEPEEEEEEEMEAEEKEAGGSGKGLSHPGSSGKAGMGSSPVFAPSQMRSRRRAAVVKRKAVRTNALAARVTARRVTGTRQVTRVAAVRTRAVRTKLALPATRKRFSVATLIRKMMPTLMMRTEGRPIGAVTMTLTVAVTGVASGAAARAGAGAPALSPVAASTRLRRMAVRPQLPIPVRPRVTVTEPPGLLGPAQTRLGQGSTFLAVCFVSLLLIPTLKPLLLIKPPSLDSPPVASAPLSPSLPQVLHGLHLKHKTKAPWASQETRCNKDHNLSGFVVFFFSKISPDH